MPLESLLDEADRVLHAANAKGIALRFLGGVAVGITCPSAANPPLSRRYVDIDVIGHRKESAKISQLFKELGYTPRERFNAFQVTRLIFNDLGNARRVDVFLDVFEMCHKFNFKNRIDLETRTLPIADLLSTKLQIVEINEKDMKDIMAMLLDHDIAEEDIHDKINVSQIARLCSEDWGIYKTFTTNLEKVPDFANTIGLGEEQKKRVLGQVGKLKKAIEDVPKSMGWKMRATVGERKRWYELPEADKEVVHSGTGAAK
jgi:Glu-tRNA(Gln) amidotransferase subunit E-like FAD-binding protein